MSSTTYRHPGNVTGMFAAQGHFRDATKTFARCNFCTLHAPMSAMVRNAGQLPEPFWLGVACGGGSRSAARCVART